LVDEIVPIANLNHKDEEEESGHNPKNREEKKPNRGSEEGRK